MNQKWKLVPGFPDYEASNLGKVRLGGALIKTCKDITSGLETIELLKDMRLVRFFLYEVIAMTYLDYELDCAWEVHHIDFNKHNNKVDNLELLPHIIGCDVKSNHSQYEGVSWSICRYKWKSEIVIKDRMIHLGYFTDELEAFKRYELAMSRIKQFISPEQFRDYLKRIKK